MMGFRHRKVIGDERSSSLSWMQLRLEQIRWDQVKTFVGHGAGVRPSIRVSLVMWNLIPIMLGTMVSRSWRRIVQILQRRWIFPRFLSHSSSSLAWFNSTTCQISYIHLDLGQEKPNDESSKVAFVLTSTSIPLSLPR